MTFDILYYSSKSGNAAASLNRSPESWRKRYDQAAEKIFTPSKLEEKLGYRNSIDENSEIRPHTKVENWERQLRRPLKSFIENNTK